MTRYRRIVLLAALIALGLVAAPDALLRLAEERYGQAAAARLRAWQQMMAQGGDETTQLRRVNDFFNQQLGFADDSVSWGSRDYWASPLESLGKGVADCEDFSIAKYISLLRLGVAEHKLRLVYVKAVHEGRPLAHMVLAYYPEPDAEPLILDNLQADVLPASRRADLTPIYSFNAEGLWLGGEQEKASRTPQQNLSQWREVLQRIQLNGL